MAVALPARQGGTYQDRSGANIYQNTVDDSSSAVHHTTVYYTTSMYTETLPESSSLSGATLTYHHPNDSPMHSPEKSADEKDNDTKTTA